VIAVPVAGVSVSGKRHACLVNGKHDSIGFLNALYVR
jgi:hypothetical protein